MLGLILDGGGLQNISTPTFADLVLYLLHTES